MPVPNGEITSTENFSQTKVTVEEVVDDMPELQDSSNAELPDGAEESK